MSRKLYITTSIPYVNSRPHLGFALELVQADVLARYHRLGGVPTYFQTGTDENAYKNVLAARTRGLATQDLVDANAALFRRLAEALNISNDAFIRTTDPAHARGVHRFWKSLQSDDLYRREYTGLYCFGCEDFYLARDLVNGCCPDHGIPPEEVQEENWFFRLSAYQDRLERLINEGQIEILPESRRNEVLSFIRRGLNDIGISRAAERCGGWGIRVPGDESQIIYVWIDALINYISGLGYGQSEGWGLWWGHETVKTHVIGKNVWKFHAIWWPALLLSAGLSLPDRIVVHGFLTENGKKISKSSGATIDPFDCIGCYGADGVRYYLLRAVSPFEDSDVSLERLRSVYNADLANGLGNVVSRLHTLWQRAGRRRSLSPSASTAPQGYHDALGSCQFDQALRLLWESVTGLNQEIERAQPWRALREGKPEIIRGDLQRWRGALYDLAYWLAPFLPQASQDIQQGLSEAGGEGNVLFPRR